MRAPPGAPGSSRWTSRQSEAQGDAFGTTTGNVTGDLNRRRGLIVNSEQRGHTRVVEAEVPLSEMFGYTTELRSMSTGRASSVMEPLKYAPVPTQVKNAILEEVG